MNDTTLEFSRLVAERHLAMTPEERLRAAADMFETARAIVESSLPAGLTTYERRLALIRRIYGSELPPAAQEAYARHGRAHAADSSARRSVSASASMRGPSSR